MGGTQGGGREFGNEVRQRGDTILLHPLGKGDQSCQRGGKTQSWLKLAGLLIQGMDGDHLLRGGGRFGEGRRKVARKEKFPVPPCRTGQGSCQRHRSLHISV